ncbi:hypothetical protein TruAng_008546 [Truncatella angustata]|nr:hypothetical protein TruAng_008546 [Truncatella angustata]
MEVSSPPKRMTRARAAAKATTTPSTAASGARATKSTAAASAKPKPKPNPTSAAAAAKPTVTRTAASMKRKTRADEDEQHEESHQVAPEASTTDTMNKPARTRGRPRKVVGTETEPQPKPDAKSEPEEPAPAVSTEEVAPAPAARATRGRAKKATQDPPKPETEPVKATRTRTKKSTADQDTTAAEPEPPKKTTRGRATSGTASSNAKSAGSICTEATTNPTPGLRSNIVRPASRLGGPTKKSVTFQEPEKENMLPPPHTKAKSKTDTEPVSGMKAKPVRKTATATRATRATAKTTTSAADKKEKPTPLSPKKDGHNRPLSRASNSDDELAAYDKPPPKPLMKGPVKPHSNRKFDFAAPLSASGADTHDHAMDDDDELAGTSVITSPAKRLPSTPFKDALKSPAKRAEGAPTLLFSSNKDDAELHPSPLKTSVLQSPAKRPQAPILAFQAQPAEPTNQSRSPMKMSLFQSPAKRPTSPIKFSAPPSKLAEEFVPSSPIANPVLGAEEQDEPLLEDDADDEAQYEEEPDSIVKPTNLADEKEYSEDIDMSQDHEEDVLESPDQLEFPGRLSAVLPRYADPALKDRMSPLKALSATQLEPLAIEDEVVVARDPESAEVVQEDVMDIDEAVVEEIDRPDSPPADTPPRPAIRPSNSMFGLREKDLLPVDSGDSDDEIVQSVQAGSKFQDDDDTLTFTAAPATPTPGASRTPRSGLPTSAIKNAGRAIRSVSRGSKLGFTPLAKQLSDWRSGSPLKNSHVPASGANEEEYSLIEGSPVGAGQTPVKGTFFDDEMRIRAEMDAGAGSDAEAEMMAAIEADLAAHFDDPEFDDIPVTNEDVELAAEANEMSLLEPDQVEDALETQNHDDSISDASQEYGDENAVPIDPALLGLPVTPVRPSSTRTFNTTTKVPLKPADDSTPRSMKRRSASASRLPAKRPAGPTRNATVISYSPIKESSDEVAVEDDEQYDQLPVTPSKSDIWSSIGTPARTPRRDLNPGLLRGAVVFVDVHTSEGADASTVFVELLTQMGARCVKSWPWNPSSTDNEDLSSSKIGITHVVYKDGGKRTMEKVRESGGVVQCVGVSWVLDCERENEWLEESAYYIDTSLVPRGGARRRKSMEPKALANHNGTLVTPMKQSIGAARDCQTVPNNHMGRRDSTAWMRSPSNRDDDEDIEGADDDEWDGSMLTPVPKTPAPEALHRYVTEMEVTPETPTAEWSVEYSPEKEQMLTRTAPPKQNTFAELGQGLLSQHKDQSVMMRLMAARRKSMQFAPKIASPLSKAWN